MRKLTLLLAIAAIAAAPSLATAKTTPHAKAHHAKVHHAKETKVAKKYADPNENTWRLFADAVAPPKPAVKKKK
jgi:hypothetical protein